TSVMNATIRGSHNNINTTTELTRRKRQDTSTASHRFKQKDAAMRNHLFIPGVVLFLVTIDVTSSYNVWRLARANCKFAFSLYGEIIKSEVGKNVFFSPFR
ncbi:hypothetical protein LSAT2_031488, partial [Lamellibrachia satsuma]